MNAMQLRSIYFSELLLYLLEFHQIVFNGRENEKVVL